MRSRREVEEPKATDPSPGGRSPGRSELLVEGDVALDADLIGRDGPLEEVGEFLHVLQSHEVEGVLGPVLGRQAELAQPLVGDVAQVLVGVGQAHVPTALQPLWHVAGFALGAATALMGERAAMACTVAVEEVIDEHYARQAEQLGPDEAELKATVEEFRQDELAHRDTGLAHGAEQAPGYEMLSAAIKSGSRLAIWLSERV